MKKSSLSMLLLSCAGFILTACSQDPYKFMFLTETNDAYAGAKLTLMHNGHYYDKLPLLTQDHFQRFKSVKNADGSYGVILYLNKAYSQRLYTATAGKQGKLVLPVLSGLAFEPLMINAPVTSGKLYVRKGLNGYDLYRLSKVLAPMDEKAEEKRYLKKDPRPKHEFKPSGDIHKDTQGRPIPQIPNVAS